METIYQEQRTEFDMGRRQELALEFQRRVLDQEYTLFFYNQASPSFHYPHVKNVSSNAQNSTYRNGKTWLDRE